MIIVLLAAILFLFGCGLFAIFLVRPQYVVPAIIIALPLEITKMFFPFLLLEKTVGGNSVSIIDFSRIILCISFVTFIIHFLTQSRLKIYGHKILFFSALFLLYSIISPFFIGSIPQRAWIETSRLGAYIFLCIITANYLVSVRNIELVLKSFIYSNLIISIFGVFQYFTGYYLWNEGLTAHGMNRINVTFADPNILSRYLAILVIFSIILLNTNITRKWILLLSIVFGSLSLLLTFSRGAWLALPICIGLLLWYLRRTAKFGFIISAVIFVMMIPIVSALSPLLRDRMASLSGGLDALGPRKDLIITGFHIYLDHLFFGTGIGSFVETAVKDYSFLLPYGGKYVTHSHCAFITIMAELGTIGVILLLLILKELYNSFVKVKASNMEPMRSYLLCSFSAVVLIFVNAQSIGRLIEEPLLWVFMGMTIAIEKIRKKNTADNVYGVFCESEFIDQKSKTCR